MNINVVFEDVWQEGDDLKFEEQLMQLADEIPHHRLVGEIGVGLMVEHIVDEGLGHLPRHPFLHVLAHEVAIFAGQLTVLSDDESDVLRHAGLPWFSIGFNNLIHS